MKILGMIWSAWDINLDRTMPEDECLCEQPYAIDSKGQMWVFPNCGCKWAGTVVPDDEIDEYEGTPVHLGWNPETDDACAVFVSYSYDDCRAFCRRRNAEVAA